VSRLPEASVVIATARDGARLEETIAVLAEATGDVAFELVVVLNAADPDVVAVVRGHPRIDVVVESAEPLGFAGACNRGRADASTPVVIVLHDDARVEEGCLAALLSVLHSRPDVGVCGPLVLRTDGFVQNAGPVLLRNAHSRAPGRGAMPEDPGVNVARLTDYCSACCLAVRVETWDATGGLEEAFFPGGYVDVDLAFAARRTGWSVWFEPAARVVHDSDAGSAATLGFKTFCHVRNREAFAAKWHDELADFEEMTGDDSVDVPRAVERASRRAGHAGRLPAGAALVPMTERELLRAYVIALEAERDAARKQAAYADAERSAALEECERLTAVVNTLETHIVDLDHQTLESALANQALTAELARLGPTPGRVQPVFPPRQPPR